jgi:hypothetical protein
MGGSLKGRHFAGKRNTRLQGSIYAVPKDELPITQQSVAQITKKII